MDLSLDSFSRLVGDRGVSLLLDLLGEWSLLMPLVGGLEEVVVFVIVVVVC